MIFFIYIFALTTKKKDWLKKCYFIIVFLKIFIWKNVGILISWFLNVLDQERIIEAPKYHFNMVLRLPEFSRDLVGQNFWLTINWGQFLWKMDSYLNFWMRLNCHCKDNSWMLQIWHHKVLLSRIIKLHPW